MEKNMPGNRSLILIIGAAILGILLVYRYIANSRTPPPFSSRFMLAALWESYKKNYWDADSGRTIDRQRQEVTTSEGQSYTMLRAVWMDDRATFERSWQWTKDNLSRPEDELFSWLYGRREDGSWGILFEQGGQNSATDADTDIALALLLAANRWGIPGYREEAAVIAADLWKEAVITAGGKPYLAANNVEKQSPEYFLVNPSYLAPYAYREFGRINPENDWLSLVDSSYELLQRSGIAALDAGSGVGLPPDWLSVNKASGAIAAPRDPALTTNFGYDALRIPFRIALDLDFSGDQRARRLLEQFSFLSERWEKNRSLSAVYRHDGQTVQDSESWAMYGGTLGYFLSAQPEQAQQVYRDKLLNLYSPDYQDWRSAMSYYDDNWAWFGLALYHGSLPNLASLPE